MQLLGSKLLDRSLDVLETTRGMRKEARSVQPLVVHFLHLSGRQEGDETYLLNSEHLGDSKRVDSLGDSSDSSVGSVGELARERKRVSTSGREFSSARSSSKKIYGDI